MSPERYETTKSPAQAGTKKRSGPDLKASLTPMRAIRAKCLDCCCGQIGEVRLCPCDDCPLHAYRHGRRPKNEIKAISEVI